MLVLTRKSCSVVSPEILGIGPTNWLLFAWKTSKALALERSGRKPVNWLFVVQKLNRPGYCGGWLV